MAAAVKRVLECLPFFPAVCRFFACIVAASCSHNCNALARAIPAGLRSDRCSQTGQGRTSCSHICNAPAHAQLQVQQATDAVKLVKESPSDLMVEGPLQYDAAIDPTQPLPLIPAVCRFLLHCCRICSPPAATHLQSACTCISCRFKVTDAVKLVQESQPDLMLTHLQLACSCIPCRSRK
jgi:hypothetical protein